MQNPNVAISGYTLTKTTSNEAAYARYEAFVERLMPYRASDFVDAEHSVTWVFSSKLCKLEVQFEAGPVARVRWHLEAENTAGLPADKEETFWLEGDAQMGKLAKLVRPVHDVIAQERAGDVVRGIFGRKVA